MTEFFNLKQQTSLRKILRTNMPKGEKMLWQKLRRNNMGYKFRRQFGVGKYVVDFYCPKLSLVIEVDGLTHDFKDRIYSDKIKQKYIESKGIKILRFNSKEIFENINSVLDQIYFVCEGLKTSPQPSPS